MQQSLTCAYAVISMPPCRNAPAANDRQLALGQAVHLSERGIGLLSKRLPAQATYLHAILRVDPGC